MPPIGNAAAVARADAVAPDPGRSSGGGVPVPLSELAPRSPAAVIDAGLELFRSRAGRLVGIAAVLLAPIWLLDLTLLALVGAPEVERSVVGPELAVLGAGAAWSWAIVVLNGLALSVLGLGVGISVSAWLDGSELTASALLARMLRRAWVAVLVAPLRWLIAMPLALCGLGVGFVLGDALLFFVSVLAGAERVGPLRAIARSCSLSWANYGRALVIVIGSLVLSQLLRVSFTLGPAALVGLLGGTEEMMVWAQRLSSAVVVVVEPITACIAAAAYLDFRCRSEGLDLLRRRAVRFPEAVPVS